MGPPADNRKHDPAEQDVGGHAGEPEEILLSGGTANHGAVVRVGETVRRPIRPQSRAVHHYLHHLRTNGVPEAAEPIGFDEQDREILRWIEGTAPERPHPIGIADDGLFVQVADLQRRMHAASASYVAPPNPAWGALGSYFPPGSEGSVVCHNDLGVSNLILRWGEDSTATVAGVIDFDYSHPVDPLFDLAVAFRHWAPLVAPLDRDPAWDGVSPPGERLELFADVHELTEPERRRMLELCESFLVQAKTNVRALADDGHPGFQLLIESGYEAENQRSVDLTRSLIRNRSS